MSEIERITDQLHRAYGGDAWHGPSIREVLEGITPEIAARMVLPETHTIWDIVLHIAAWETYVRRRLEGEVLKGLPDEVNWPTVNDSSAPAWQRTVVELNQGQLDLITTVSRMDDGKLNETVPDTDFSYYVLLHGLVQHALYHAGQIALLKKAKS